MQLPLQLAHAFLQDIDALEDPDPDPDPDPELIEALALSSLPVESIWKIRIALDISQ
jgi:hypothetical protein